MSLVSLNPDKEHYPDIELAAEDDEAVTIVAKVVQSLSVNDYERRPKTKRRAGRRTLAGREGLEEQAKRLERRVASFFDPSLPEDKGEETGGEPSRTGWQTRLVCLEEAAGGVQLEIGPLEGLPPFVKKLKVVGSAEWDAFVLAGNARARAVRVPVRPSTGSWRWEAVGFELEQDLGMDRLTMDALDSSAPLVFRVDAEGVGQLLKGASLALGQAYRLLLPPTVGDSSLGADVDAGWRLWSINLASPPSATTREALASIGLGIGEAWPRLDWALFPAGAWRTNARGDSYPIFNVGTEVLVAVNGVSADDGDTAMLFLHGQTGTERLTVSGDGIVSLGTPALGRWACAFLHSRTTVQPTTLVFEVAESAMQHVAAAWSSSAPSGVSSLEIAAPPGWPVALRWAVLHEDLLATVYANDDAIVELDALRTRIADRARTTRRAELVLDCGELGRRSIAHETKVGVDELRPALTALWEQRSSLVQSRKGAWMTLLPAWFEPVTALLGYGLEPLTDGRPSAVGTDIPHDLAAWRLTVDERFMGSITRVASRVLILTTDIDAALRDCREWVDQTCTVVRVREAIVTDGTRWTTHHKNDRHLRRPVWNLDHAIGLGDLDRMIENLADGL